MKLSYGKYNETNHNEVTILAEPPAIKSLIESLAKKYDWIRITDNSGKDITNQFI